MSAPSPAPAVARHETLVVGAEQVELARGGDGWPLLYLHGLCDIHAAAPGDRLTPFLGVLAAGRQVVAPALPGYGRSTGLEAIHDVEDYVFGVVDLLRALGIDHVDVVGHSLGGWLAAETALRRPDVVRKLVLVAPLGLHVAGVSVPPLFGALAPRGVGGFGESRRILFADSDGPVAMEALPDAMSEEQQLRWFGGLAGAARLGWKAPHFQSRRLAERLGRVAVPTLVVAGEQDLLVPEAVARAWVDGIPAAELFEVPDAAHALALEWPEVAGDVLRWVEA